MPDPRSFVELDVILVSHGHADHFDLRSLAAIPEGPLLVVPRGLGPSARAAFRGQVQEIAAGERIAIGAANVTAIPARHWISPGAPRAKPLGYLIEAGPRVYFAGDTGRFAALRRLAGRVDIALLPVWTWGPHLGPGHMGPRAAAEVAGQIGPQVAVPIHWGTLYPKRLHRVWRGPLIDPGQRFADHAAVTAPAVDVRVLRPGTATRIVLG